jgi:hypothetical protein
MEFPSFVSELPITRSALEFAADRHTGQRRDADRAPFILHSRSCFATATTRTRSSPPASCTT